MVSKGLKRLNHFYKQKNRCTKTPKSPLGVKTLKTYCFTSIGGTMEKNITIQQYNGEEYDILYPKTTPEQAGTFSKDQIVSTETLERYGFTEGATPNDVFYAIATQGEGRYQVRVVTEDGNPVSNLPIHGLVSQNGTTMYTNSQGYAVGYANASIFSVSPQGDVNILDLENGSIDVPQQEGLITNVTLVCNNKTLVGLKTFTSSGSYRLARAWNNLPVCCVGGGAAGYSTYWKSGTSYVLGYGGAGGEITNSFINIPQGGDRLIITIGAGGAAKSTTSSSYTTIYYQARGARGTTTLASDTSSFETVVANRGTAGTSGTSGITPGSSANGGEPVRNRDSTEFPFGDETQQVSGAGGRGSTSHQSNYVGGKAYGGEGGYVEEKSGLLTADGSPAKGYGGGGGGGICFVSPGASTSNYITGRGGAGHKGVVMIKFPEVT